MAVHIAGPLGYAADSGKAFKGIDSTLLFATVAVVVVLLLVIYRSPVLWLLPVISAGVALTCVQALIYLLAAHAGPTVNAQSAGILYVLTLLPALLVIGSAKKPTTTAPARCADRPGRHVVAEQSAAVQ